VAALQDPHFCNVQMADAGLHSGNHGRMSNDDRITVLPQLGVVEVNRFVGRSAGRGVVNKLFFGLSFCTGMGITEIRREELIQGAPIPFKDSRGPFFLRVRDRRFDAGGRLRRGQAACQREQAEEYLCGSFHGLHSFTTGEGTSRES